MGFNYPTFYPGSIYEPAFFDFGLHKPLGPLRCGCSAPYISNSVASLISIIFAATAITSGQQYLIKFAGRQAGCADEGKVFDGPVLRKILFRRIMADGYCFAS
jgi:hypothetical protein